MCGCILAINLQNFTEIYLAYVKILQKVLGGYFFYSHCICLFLYVNCVCIVLLVVCLCLSVCFYILSVLCCHLANKRAH